MNNKSSIALLLLIAGASLLVGRYFFPDGGANSELGRSFKITGGQTNTSVSVGINGAVLLAANSNRNAFDICVSTSTGGPVFIQLAYSSSSVPAGVPLNYLGCYSSPEDSVWTGPVYGIALSGSATTSIIE